MGKNKKGNRQVADRTAYATPADFERIFSEDVNSLYLLSLLLAGNGEKAEECFVEGIGESTKGNYVFKEWARSWARRTIIQSAVRLIKPIDYAHTLSRRADVAPRMERIPVRLHAEVHAILELAPLQRFVFIMSVLERYSDNDCSILLGCARREIAAIRSRAMQQLATLLNAKYPLESSADNSVTPETIATSTTPLIDQYFAASGVELRV